MLFLIIVDGPVSLLPLYGIVIPISVSVTATDYNTVSKKKFNFRTYILIVGKTYI